MKNILIVLLVTFSFAEIRTDAYGNKFDVYDDAVVNMQTGEAKTFQQTDINKFIDNSGNTYELLKNGYVLYNKRYLYKVGKDNIMYLIKDTKATR